MGRRSRLRTAHALQRQITNSAPVQGDAPRANVRSRALTKLEAHGRQGKPGQTWYRIDNLVQNPGVASVYLYGEIGMWGVTAEDFVRELQGVTAGQIDLHLNSMGGDVFEGIAILNALRGHRAEVTTYVDSLAASIASVVAMAGNKIVMARNATLMIHEASSIEIGDAAAMRAMADLLDKTSNNIASVYAERAGGDVEQWRAAMQTETWYSADEAVAAGLADEVTAAPATDDAAPDEAMTNSFDLSVFRYAGREQAPAPARPSASADQPAPVVPVLLEAEGPPVDPVPPEVEPDPADDAEPVAEPELVPEPRPDPEPVPAPPVDEWAAMTASLLTPIPAPSTVDELFAALKTKGLA